MSVKDWAQAVNGKQRFRDMILSFAKMYVTFSREVLCNEDVSRIQSDAELLAWEQEKVEEIMASLLKGASEPADFSGAVREHESWRVEMKHEVMVLAGDLVPLAYVKLLVLWSEGQARLVTVDHLCRNRTTPHGVGRVGSVVVEQVLARYPVSSAILCTVTAKRPAPFAQKEEDRLKALRAYRRMGFREMPRGGGVYRCLQPLAEWPGKSPQWAGARLAALAGLLADSAVRDSLPMTKADMHASAPRRIAWWELAGRPEGEAWWAALAAERPAGPSAPAWLRVGAQVEARCKEEWWLAIVAEVRPAGTRALEARIHYVSKDGAASGYVRFLFRARPAAAAVCRVLLAAGRTSCCSARFDPYVDQFRTSS
jgi:hypothetical protein